MDLLLTLHGGTVFVAFLITCPTLFNQASSCKMEPVLFVGLCQANLRDLGLILSWEVTNTEDNANGLETEEISHYHHMIFKMLLLLSFS